jgi:hypothetical protein
MVAAAELTVKLIGQDMLSGMFRHATGSLKSFGAAVTAPIKGVATLAAVGVKGLGAIGLAGMGLEAVGSAAKGLGGALGIGLNSELEILRAQFLAITKDSAGTEKMLAGFQARADKTPFGLTEVAKAGAMLLPAAKQAKMGLDPLLDTASMLAALNPAEGLEGAAFSLREALSGDFVSIVERFNLPRDRIKALKKQGVPAMKIINQVLQEMGIDMSLVTAMGETFEGRMSTLKDTIAGFRRTLSKPLFDELKLGIIFIQGLLDDNKDAITAWATVWGQRIGAVAKKSIDIIAAIIAEFRSLAQFLGGGEMFDDSMLAPFAQSLGIVRDAFRAFFGTLSDGEEDVQELTGLPRLFGELGLALHKAGQFIAPFVLAFRDLGTAIAHIVKGNAGVDLFISEFQRLFGIDISGIIGRFQMIFFQIGDIIRKAAAGDIGGAVQGVLDLVVGARLDLIEAVGTWAAAFVNWLAPHIPAILNAVGQVVVAIGNWIQTRGPEIQARLMGWVTAFTNWVAPMIPPLLEQLQGVAAQIGAWITANAEPFLQQFITEWLPTFVNWLADAGTALLPHLTAFLETVKTWVKENAAPMLEAFIAHWTPKFVEWLGEAAKQIIPRLLAWQFEILKWIAEKGVPAFIQMGIDLGIALVNGIIQALQNLTNDIRAALIAAGVPLPGGGVTVPVVPPGVTQRPPAPAGVTERPPVPTADPATQAQMIAIKTELIGVTEAMRAMKIALGTTNQTIAQTPAAFKTAASQLIGPY